MTIELVTRSSLLKRTRLRCRRPAAGNEAAHGHGTADRRKHETGVVARDLQAEELHGVFPPSLTGPALAGCQYVRLPSLRSPSWWEPRRTFGLHPFVNLALSGLLIELERQDDRELAATGAHDLRQVALPVQRCLRLQLTGVTIHATGSLDLGTHGRSIGFAAQLGSFGLGSGLSELCAR